tara:strand:- start:718 stop:891 length:174 start_codon:yes stop_codon:yes gene_type:complete
LGFLAFTLVDFNFLTDFLLFLAFFGMNITYFFPFTLSYKNVFKLRYIPNSNGESINE